MTVSTFDETLRGQAYELLKERAPAWLRYVEAAVRKGLTPDQVEEFAELMGASVESATLIREAAMYLVGHLVPARCSVCYGSGRVLVYYPERGGYGAFQPAYSRPVVCQACQGSGKRLEVEEEASVAGAAA
ncbi:MAG TPA: hypothetical protein VEX13_01055 [Chloroflexia bacterium]|nr:hypothetical protein [Chloroflexia bacterium]